MLCVASVGKIGTHNIRKKIRMNELCNIGRDYIHVVSSLRLSVGKFVNAMCSVSRKRLGAYNIGRV